MAKIPKYTEQFSFVGTVAQHEIVKAVTQHGYDKVEIVREAMDSAFGLVDGELTPGDTLEDAAARVLERMQNPVKTVGAPAV